MQTHRTGITRIPIRTALPTYISSLIIRHDPTPSTPVPASPSSLIWMRLRSPPTDEATAVVTSAQPSRPRRPPSLNTAHQTPTLSTQTTTPPDPSHREQLPTEARPKTRPHRRPTLTFDNLIADILPTRAPATRLTSPMPTSVLPHHRVSGRRDPTLTSPMPTCLAPSGALGIPPSPTDWPNHRRPRTVPPNSDPQPGSHHIPLSTPTSSSPHRMPSLP